MHFSRTESRLPELIFLPQNDLAVIIKQLLSQKCGSFSFSSLTRELAEYIKRTGKGYKADPSTEYVASLNERDIMRVREVIWDLIIERSLTPGGYQTDSFDWLTISERGMNYFKKYSS